MSDGDVDSEKYIDAHFDDECWMFQVKLSENLEHIVLIDPNGKKAPKQIYVRHVTELRTGACTVCIVRNW